MKRHDILYFEHSTIEISIPKLSISESEKTWSYFGKFMEEMLLKYGNTLDIE